MISLEERKKSIEHKIFKDVIYMKNLSNISTYQICKDLSFDEETITEYILGKSKDDVSLGLQLLNYLEKKYNG